VSASICSLLGGCNDPGCIRNNQCSGGAVCSLGSCVFPPADARGEHAGDAKREGVDRDLGAKDGRSEAGGDGAKKADGLRLDGLKDGLKVDGLKLDGVPKGDGLKPDGLKPDGAKLDGGKKELGGG
jgi:hypothetical protein